MNRFLSSATISLTIILTPAALPGSGWAAPRTVPRFRAALPARPVPPPVNLNTHVLLPNGRIVPFNAMVSQAPGGAINRNVQFLLPNGAMVTRQFNTTPPQGPNGQATANLNSRLQLPNGLVAQINAMVARGANGALTRNIQRQFPDGTTINTQFNRTSPQGPNGQVTTTAQVQVTGNPNALFSPMGIGPLSVATSPYLLTSNPYASLALSRGTGGAGYSSYGGYSPGMGYGAGMGQGYYGNRSGNYANRQQQASSQVPAQTDGGANDKALDKSQLDWPLGLRILPPDLETKPLRRELDTLLRTARGQASSTGRVQPRLISKAERDIKKLRKLLDERGPTLPVSDYAITEAKHFLTRLKDLFNSL